MLAKTKELSKALISTCGGCGHEIDEKGNPIPFDFTNPKLLSSVGIIGDEPMVFCNYCCDLIKQLTR